MMYTPSQTICHQEDSTPVAATRPLARLARWSREVWQAGVRLHRRRRTIRILSELDDRTLQDIGLRRDEITSYAHKGGDGRPPARRHAPLYMSSMY